MEEEKININGVEYIKKPKEESKSIADREYYLMEPCNVLAILPVKRNFEGEEIIVEGIGNYKRCSEDVSLCKVNLKNMKSEVFSIGKSNYSIEFLEKARKTAKAFIDCDTPEFYKSFEEDQWIEDAPLIIKFDTMYFILAPRVYPD